MNAIIRKTIACRLSQEMTRKGLTPLSLAKESRLSMDRVQGYLTGVQEIQFDELRPLCKSLSLGLMRLLAHDFDTPKLQYRTTGAGDRAKVTVIENAFLLIANCLPTPKRLSVSGFRDQDQDIGMLLAEINTLVEKLRSQHTTVEALYRATNLPILPIHAGSEAFDAFLMSVGNYAIVCINADKSAIRIHFSLLHELAHFLLHINQEIPVDLLPLNLYSDRIRGAEKPEYVANKFAQLYLIPFEVAEQLAKHWAKLEDQTAYLAERRTGSDVLTNALYDSLRLRDPKVRYTDIRGAVNKSVSPGYGRDTSILDFIETQGCELRNKVIAERDNFSDDVWAEIAEAWEIQND